MDLFNQFIFNRFVNVNRNTGEFKMHEYDDEAEALASEDRATKRRLLTSLRYLPGDPEAPYEESEPEADTDDGSDEQ